MKKVSLLSMMFAAIFLCSNVFAQEFSFNFDDAQSGDKVAETYGEPWTTWSMNPGSAEDGVISNEQAGSGSNSLKLEYGNDQVVLFGGKETGSYSIEFDLYVPEGKNAYFNLLHNFNGTNSTWGAQIYFHLTNDGQNSTPAPGQGMIHAAANSAATFTCVYDEWMHIEVLVDTDNDQATFKINDEEIHTWVWSWDSFGEAQVGRKLDAMNFFPPEDAATSTYYVDNVTFTNVGGDTFPIMNVDVDEIAMDIEPDEYITTEFNITNEGTSIGDWVAWVDYGAGAGGSSQEIIHYDGDPHSGVGFTSGNPLIEVGAMFPASSYAGAVMGMDIVGMQYYAMVTAQSQTVGFTGDLTFRIYEQGLYDSPGELLAEKVLPAAQIIEGDWNTITFDTPIPLTGYDVWATVEYQQVTGGMPISMDGMTPVPFGDMVRRDMGPWSSINEGATEPYGNHNIRVTCQGSLVPGTWASMDKRAGSISAGQQETVTLSLNSIAMEIGTYNANVYIKTNDTDNPEIIIPVTMNINGVAVDENAANQYNIYPNPTMSVVKIEGDNINCVAIYNSVGQLVNVVRMDNASNEINMSQYGAGVYFFNIVNNEGNSSVQRVVVSE